MVEQITVCLPWDTRIHEIDALRLSLSFAGPLLCEILYRQVLIRESVFIPLFTSHLSSSLSLLSVFSLFSNTSPDICFLRSFTTVPPVGQYTAVHGDSCSWGNHSYNPLQGVVCVCVCMQHLDFSGLAVTSKCSNSLVNMSSRTFVASSSCSAPPPSQSSIRCSSHHLFLQQKFHHNTWLRYCFLNCGDSCCVTLKPALLISCFLCFPLQPLLYHLPKLRHWWSPSILLLHWAKLDRTFSVSSGQPFQSDR